MEVNKGAIALVMVLLVLAGGYLWYSNPYADAKEKMTAATTAKTAADTELQAAQSELSAAQQRVDEAKKELGKLDDSVPRLQIARKAVPNKDLVDDAAIVLMDLAERSGITTSFSSGGDEGGVVASPTGDLQGATPVDLTFEAAGTYSEMMLFMSLVEGTVEAKDGKLHARDRLFNVVRLQIGEEGDDDSSSSFSDEDSGEGGLVVKPGELVFTVTVRMYTSSTENAQGVGAATPDPAAAPTDPNAAAAGGAPTDPNAAAAGGAPIDPNAAAPVDGAAATSDPNAAGAAPVGAAPTGGAP